MTMKTQWKNLDPPAQQALMQRFVNHAIAQDWIEQLPALRLRQLYAFALDADMPDKEQILLALQQDAATQKRYVEILNNLNAREMINAAATSAETAGAAGHSKHWRYHLEAAAAPLEESYLMIEIAAGAMPPSRFFAKCAQFGGRDIRLVKAQRGLIQMVFPNTDLLVKILNQTDREVRMW